MAQIMQITDPAALAVASNLFVEEWIGHQGSLAPDRDGQLITTGANAGDVEGLAPAANTLFAAPNYFKTGDQPWLQIQIKTPADLTGIEFLFGFVTAKLDDAGGVITKDEIGRYNNAVLTHGIWYWFDKATDSGKLCCGYRDGFGGPTDQAKVVLTTTLAVATEYELYLTLDATRKAHFSVNGVEAHVAGVALTDALVMVPRFYLKGNQKTMYRRTITGGKTYS